MYAWSRTIHGPSVWDGACTLYAVASNDILVSISEHSFSGYVGLWSAKIREMSGDHHCKDKLNFHENNCGNYQNSTFNF